MESKIAGYKLVPDIDGCRGCAFCNAESCPLDYDNEDCLNEGAIYVPADTSIEVPKVNQQDNEQ